MKNTFLKMLVNLFSPHPGAFLFPKLWHMWEHPQNDPPASLSPLNKGGTMGAI